MKKLQKTVACLLVFLSTTALANQSTQQSIIKFNDNINSVEISKKTTSQSQNKQVYLKSPQLGSRQIKSVNNLETVSVIDLLNQKNKKQPIKSSNSGEPNIFFEDFQGQALPTGWVQIDLDGNTPNPNLGNNFPQAWNIIQSSFDPNNLNYSAASSSWYDPAGRSDDWLITPQINIGPDNVLSWLAASRDASFPDGYEIFVSTTTQDIAGCSQNQILIRSAIDVATDDLTLETIDLFAEGFGNQPIFVCFRENNFDTFILEIDDITITGSPPPLPDIFFEDFQGQVLPSNWAIFDVDGNTPSPEVAFINQAWIVTPSGVPTSLGPTENYVAASTSYYSPEGTADDWMISPQIHIGPDSILTWLAANRDSGFPDGYEVYISTTTQDVAGCLNSPLSVGVLPVQVTTDELTQETYEFIAQGYSNQLIYVCFRNNTNNGVILEIDDVRVTGTPPTILANDLSVSNPTVPEYTIVPDSIGYVSKPIGVDITNNGSNTQSNMSLAIQLKHNGEIVQELTSPIKNILASGENVTIEIGLINTVLGGRAVVSISYELLLDGVKDDNPADNVIIDLPLMVVDGKSMARDDGVTSTAFSLGSGIGGQMGQSFVIEQAAELEKVFFVIQNSICDAVTLACSLDNLDITADVYSADPMTGPTTLIASTEAFTVPVNPFIFYELELPVIGGPLQLMPGSYVVVINEPVDPDLSDMLKPSLGLLTTDNRFTIGTTWYKYTGSTVWDNLETIGFLKTFILRLIFVDPEGIFASSFE